ncbi:MAG TPA: cytochrome c-type biogenesis CcmF C-terminal domain-containing protein, partial [Polyangia bacterium]|nr:cytochrome c-type biogenesis CcmF C-terminal domain-containing protein [Polyangia bacterium]
ILTFFLTIFGTFMTRSGIVQSVHAFGQDTTLAWIFTAFMAFIIIVSFGFVIKRLPELRARATFDSWLSREAAFTVNNWILLFAAFFIMFATMFPTLSDALMSQRITVGPPFFNKWMVPIGLILLFLTGIGPGIAWRKATLSHLRYQFMWPTVACAVAVAICLALGLQTSWAAVVCFGFCAFTTTTIVQEFLRGVAIRRRNTGSDALSALLGMVIKGKRRYGGYIVHVGIVLMFVGFAGTAYQKESELRVTPGGSQTVGKYTLRFDRLAHEEDLQKEMVTGEVTAFGKDGNVIAHLRPAKWFFHGHESEPTTEVAIRRAPAEDLYLTLGGYDLSNGTAVIKVVINPVVDWIWFGFMLLAMGTGVALMPESVLERMTAKVTAGAPVPRAPGMAGLALLMGAGVASMLVPRTAVAQDMPGGQEAAPEPVGVDELWLVHNIMCQCGSCRHNLMECASENCGNAIQNRLEIRQLLNEKQTRDQIIQHFISKYGSQIALASPIDKGFNRLAWLLPYSLGTLAAGGMVYGAYRLTRKPPAPPEAKAVTAAEDPELADKLEDELRNLD